MDSSDKAPADTMTKEQSERKFIERELAEYVRRYVKGALAKGTELAVKSSRSKHAVDIQKLAARHYEDCVQKTFDAIHRLFEKEGLLEQIARLRAMADEQNEFKTTPLRLPTGIASLDTQLLVDVLNSGLLRSERQILEELKLEQNRLVDEFSTLTSTT